MLGASLSLCFFRVKLQAFSEEGTETYFNLSNQVEEAEEKGDPQPPSSDT